MTEPLTDLLPAGTPAPDFSLHATPDQLLSLSELRGHPVFIAFYPADWSEVCGDELNVINEALPLFRASHTVVLGISVDSVWSHEAFVADRKLHFSLLSDFEPKGAVASLYGAYDTQTGACKRAQFLIDADGVIAWSDLSPVGINPGVDGALDALDQLTGNAPTTT